MKEEYHLRPWYKMRGIKQCLIPAVIVIFLYAMKKALFIKESPRNESNLIAAVKLIHEGKTLINDSQRLSDMTYDLLGLNRNTTKMEDPKLISMLKKYWLKSPSNEPYNLTAPLQKDFSAGQSPIVDLILRQKERGFFIECGALDGETRSNTLFFERERHWQGLLIEADSGNYRSLLQKHRKAWSSPICLGVNPYPQMMNFNRAVNKGRLIDGKGAIDWVHSQKLPVSVMQTQCFPLYSLLLAVNVTTVDYFSLDVEGVELDILKTIPFDKVDIKVLTVEFKHGAKGKEELMDFMIKKGYKMVYEVYHSKNQANDLVLSKL